MAIYFFDKNQTLIKIVPESATFEAIQTQELDDDSLLKDTLSVTVKGDEKLINAEYMAVKSYKGNAQTFDMYRIVTDTTPDKSMSFTGMSLAPYELNGHILQDLRPANHSLSYTLNRVLDGTDWRVGYIEDGLSNVSTTFYYVSAKEALKELQSLVGCEFVFKVEISGQKITDKWIEVYKEMGNRTKKRFNYGTNALTVVRETNKADIYTALIGRGKGEEVSSADENESGQAGYGRKITFEDIEWSTANGNPLNKPIGQYYLELPQATQAYGIKNIDGTMSARVGIVDFGDEEDKNRLINLTYQQLLVSSRPKVLFKTTVANVGATGIGDTVTIHRHDLNIHYQTRVRKIVRNKLNDNKTQIELGDAVVTPSTKRTKQNNATIKNLNQEIEKVKADVTISQTSADGKNAINYGSAEPEIKRTGDTWYRPHPSIAGETQMLVWDGNAWELVIDTSDLSSVSRAVEDAAEKADEAVQSAKDSDEKAEAIKQGLGLSDITLTNQQITDQIMSDYNTIKQNSTNALTDAGKALTDAQNAQQDTDKAIEDFETFLTSDFASAENDIATAQTTATNALTNAGKALTDAYNAQQDAYNAQQDADKAIEDFKTFLTSDFASVENDIVAAQTTATDALNKAGTAVSDLDAFKIDYNTFITDTFDPAFTVATDALSLAERNEGLFYSANLIDEETGQSNVYTKAQIDGTNGYVTKSTFNQNTESISSELERVEGVALASGANINLLVVKNAKNNTWLDTNPSSRTYPTPNDTSNATATSPDLISVTAGEKVTLSKTTVSGDNNFRIDFLDSNKAFISRLAVGSNSQTITIPDNVAYMWVSYPMDSFPKVERGEIKTQWTLAPQDQVNQSTINYFTSKINQTPELISEALLAYTPTDSLDDTVSSYLSNDTTKTAGAIDTKLTSYAKTTALNGLATETFAVNKATETANGVKNELIEVIGTKVDSGTLNGYVSTATYDEGVKGISKSISTVEGKIPTAIGGRNLLRGTANFNTPLWRNVATAIPSTRDYRYRQVRVDGDYTVAPITTMATQEWNFEAGEDYVVSVYAKSEVLGNKLGLTAQDTPYFEPQVVAVSEWRRFVWKFKATISNLANFRFETRNGERVWITQPQVEKGTILTDWSLAPEDLQTIDALDSNIVSLYNNTSTETSKAFSRTLTAYTPTSELDNKTKNYLTNNNYQTAEMVKTTLTAYTPTESLDDTVSNYLSNTTTKTAGVIDTKLTSYAKSVDLNGLASETFASNIAVSEAGKVKNELTKYAKTTALDGLATEEYAQTQATTEAGKVEQKLTGYAKSTDLNGLATETYATNEAVSEAGKVSNELTKYAKSEDLNGLATETFATNKATETANGVKNELVKVIGTKVDLDTLDGYVSQATYDTGVEGISKSISTVEGKIPTAIGGRNLLRGTANFNTPLWQNVMTAIPSTRDSRYKQVRVDGDYAVAPITLMSDQDWNFEIGQDYVVSVYAKSEVLGNKLGLTAQSELYFEPQVVAVSEWRRYVWKFKATISNLTRFRFETRNGERVWITQPQVEKGTILTDWSLAPEDLQTIDALDSNIVSLYNNTSSETSKAISQTLTAYTPTDSLDDKTKNYLTNNNYQTAEMVETTLASYTPTNSLDGTVANYLKSSTSQTAGAITTKLSDYQTKSDLDTSVKSLFSNTNNQTAQYIDTKLSAYTTDESFNGKTQSYLTNNNYQTAEMVETKLTAYTPTTSLDNKTQAYLTSKQYQTASQVSTTLAAYTKTENLDGTVASYLNSSTSQTAGAIATKLTAYTPTSNLDAKTQSYLTNNSYQTAGMVETKLASYQTKTDLDGSVASILDNTESQTAGRINSKLTDIQAQIPTEFGGRNLLRGTADFDTTFWRNVSTVIPSSRDIRYKQVRVDGDYAVAPITLMSDQDWNFEIGQEYTISVWAKSEVLGNKLGVTAQSTPYFEPQVVTLSKWSRYTWTFTATMSNLTNFRFETRNGERVWITQPQIEKGSIPTDWTRAVEDLATVVQTNEIERTANYTKSAITNVTKDGLVTGSTVNQSKDGITERVARLDTNGNVTYANRDVKLDSIVSTVANDKYISNIIQASDLVQSTIRENTNVDLLAKSASGTGMTADPNFNKGINGLTVYDSGNTNTISIYRNLTNDQNLPSGKGYRLDIYHASSTATSPYRGGVALPTQSWANGIVVVRFTAKLDVGKSFVYAQNSIGTGSTHGWLTTNKGTGNWEQYAYYYRFGTSGTFQTFGFISVNATSAAFTWRLADFDIINLGMSSQSQITQLQESIDLKVSDKDLLSRINVRAGNILIQSGTNKLNITPTTTYIEDSTIKSAMIESLEAGKIKTGTLDAGKVKVINIDAENITSNKTSFIQSNWNDIESSISINGNGLLSTASDGSQVYLQNGIVGARNPQGATIGQIGYAYETESPWYSMQVSHGSHFQIRMGRGAGKLNKQAFYIISGGTESYLNTDNIYLNPSDTGRVRVQGNMSIDKNLSVGNEISGTNKIRFAKGAYLEEQANGNTQLKSAGTQLQFYQASGRIMYSDGTRLFLDMPINMQSNGIFGQSDERVKTNITPLVQDSLEIFRQLNYYSYNMIEDDRATFGFIAQELQNIAPHMVHEEDDGLLAFDVIEYTNLLGHAVKQNIDSVDYNLNALDVNIGILETAILELQAKMGIKPGLPTDLKEIIR